MLPLEDFIVTHYKTAARIDIIRPKTDFMQSADFVKKISLESSPANETPSSDCARKHQNLDYFIGFIDSGDVEAKLTISLKC